MESSWAALGRLLGRSNAAFGGGVSRRLLGGFWAVLGRLWGGSGAVLVRLWGGSGAALGSSWELLGFFSVAVTKSLKNQQFFNVFGTPGRLLESSGGLLGGSWQLLAALGRLLAALGGSGAALGLLWGGF